MLILGANFVARNFCSPMNSCINIFWAVTWCQFMSTDRCISAPVPWIHQARGTASVMHPLRLCPLLLHLLQTTVIMTGVRRSRPSCRMIWVSWGRTCVGCAACPRRTSGNMWPVSMARLWHSTGYSIQKFFETANFSIGRQNICNVPGIEPSYVPSLILKVFNIFF